jgi:predicted metal-dependent enzyme (double-stranded beta helix superfamily)
MHIDNSSVVLDPNSLKLVQMYCKTATSLDISEVEERKIREILELALYDKQLSQWLNLTDMLIDYYLKRGQLANFNIIKSFLSIKYFNDILIQRIENSHGQEITTDEFKKLIKRLQISQDFIKPCIEFSHNNYCRNLIFKTNFFCIYVIGWQPKQYSDIHHHGCELDAIMVHEGKPTHWLFDKNQRAISKSTLSKNDLLIVKRHQYHNIGNDSDNQAVTIHYRLGNPPKDNHWQMNDYTENLRAFWYDINQEVQSTKNTK